MRWLHLSDFHLKSDAPYDQDTVLQALINSLPDLVERYGKPDLLILSGDLAHSGKKQQYDEAGAFLRDVISILGLQKERVFMIPGNHDVDRERAAGLSRTLSDTEEADIYFSPKLPLVHVERKLSAFSKFYNDFYNGVRLFPTDTTCSMESIEVHGAAIRVMLVNSATFCLDDNDAHKLFVGRRCIEAACGAHSPADLSFAIFHHPLHWLSPVESTQVKALVHDNCDIVLNGHLHENEVEQVVGSSGNTLHLAAGATYQTRKWPNTAMMCELLSGTVTVTPFRYVDSPRPAWTLDTALFLESTTYQGRYSLSGTLVRETLSTETVVEEASNSTSEPNAVVSVPTLLPTDPAEVVAARAQLEERLFTTPSGKPVFAEPRIMPRTQVAALDSTDDDAVTVEEIAAGEGSFFIESRSEYGGSTLAKTVQLALVRRGCAVLQRSARDLPKYRRKIISELSGSPSAATGKPTLIIDDFDLERDDRTLSELHDAELFTRVIIISTNRGIAESVLTDIEALPFTPKLLHLWAMGRDGIRQFAEAILEASDIISTERAVSKVYSDLLGLKIPLTPSNVIMYLRVLQREGDFEPLSRVDILSRYLAESLRRPSDVASDSFNAKNKMDVLSSFAYWLYEKRPSDFTEREWLVFCEQYQNKTLSEFEPKDFFNELLSAKVFGTYRGGVYFRYGFYFTFFVGRYMWPRPTALKSFIASQDFMSNPAVIDVVTGLSSENSELVTSLVEILEAHVQAFAQKYVRQEFDPLLKATWPNNEDEEDKVWKPVQQAIASGPADAKEIDELKTSMLAEARTANQQVTFEKFTQLEHALFVESHVLGEALKNADDVDGGLKLRAWKSILTATLIVLQVGTMFAPALARRKRFSWGGVTFLDFDKAAEGLEGKPEEAFASVVTALATAAASKTAQDYGSIKLGPVFRSTSKLDELSGFFEVVNFTCIITARGRGWIEAAVQVIERADKSSYYLSELLHQMMRTLKFEIMPGRDREGLKRLVAQVRAKRDFNKQAPGSKAVSKMLSFLEKDNFFPTPADPATGG